MRSKTLSVSDVADVLGVSMKTARRLFSDQGGPLYRIPHTGRRVITSRGAVDAYLAPPADPATLNGPIGVVA